MAFIYYADDEQEIRDKSKSALVYYLELDHFNVTGLPKGILLKDVGSGGSLLPRSGFIVLIVELNVKVACNDNVVGCGYAVCKPRKGRSHKHGNTEKHSYYTHQKRRFCASFHCLISF